MTLKELKESVCDTTAGKKIRYKRHLHKVTMIRREIRVQNFASPISYEQNNLISSDELPLDSDLANLKYTVVENYDHYKEQYGLHSLFRCNIKTPIFVTPRERQEDYKIEKRKKSDILSKIKNIIVQMPDNELANSFMKECIKGERLKHQELVGLHCEVKESLSAQSALVSVEPADNEIIFESD